MRPDASSTSGRLDLRLDVGGAWLIPALGFLGLFFVVPIGAFAGLSIFTPDFSLTNYRHMFSEPLYLHVFWITFKTSFLVTAATVCLGYPYAYAIYRARGVLRLALFGLIILPFWTSLLVRTFAFMLLLQDHGPVNQLLVGTGLIGHPLQLVYNTFGVVFGMTYMLLPYFVLPLYGAMQRIDPLLEKAARSLGAANLRAIFSTIVPLSLPGALGGAALVLMMALGFFVTPALLGGAKNEMLSMLIADQVNQLLNWGFASALCVTLVAMTAVLGGLGYAAGRWYGRRVAA